jgi:hypothetical protein
MLSYEPVHSNSASNGLFYSAGKLTRSKKLHSKCLQEDATKDFVRRECSTVKFTDSERALRLSCKLVAIASCITLHPQGSE